MNEEQIEEQIEDQIEAEEESPSLEQVASELGWAPQDEWKGDPELWVSADKFIRKTMDVQRKQSLDLKQYHSKLESLEQKLGQMAATQSKAVMSALKEQKERLQREFEEAVEAGDKAAAKRATDGMRDLDNQVSQNPDMDAEKAKWQPHAQRFIEANGAVLQNKLAAVEANELVEKLYQAGVSPEETYEIVEQKLRKEFPEAYMNQNRVKPPKVGGESRPTVADKSTWGKLVKEFPEAKSHFERFVRQGVFKDTKEDRERYAKTALED